MVSSGHNALLEYFGGSFVNTNLAADFALRLPYSTNCCRHYVLGAGVTFNVVLPNTNKVYTPVGSVYTIVIGFLSSPLNLRDHLGNLVRTMPGDTGWDVYWTGSAWATFATLTPILSAPLSATRVPVYIPLRNSVSGGVELATWYGYNSTTPAAVTCEVFPGVAIGSSSAGVAALRSGTWPAGTTIVLMVGAGAFVSGRGGNGGRGQDAVGASPLSHLPPTAGFAGGAAIDFTVNHSIVNWGTIQGGGGGGGGGSRGFSASPFPGGGGGGGAGHDVSAGGSGGLFSGGLAGAPGFSGTLQLGGSGGTGIGAGVLFSGSGGSGGSPGQAGSSGGLGFPPSSTSGAGGAAGVATRRPSAVTQTVIRAGTVLGSHVTY
ncbi:MAG: hypothetical protein WAT39_07050 [Planctomycetota bacterium]